MIKKIGISLVLICMSLVCPAQTATDYYALAEKAFEEMRYEQAEEYLRTYEELTGEMNTSLRDRLNSITIRLIDGHPCVDLGLSVLWSTCNLGAGRPEDCGEYFSWGEISPKSSYRQNNSTAWNVKMECISGNQKYDAAAKLWGDRWEIPTKTAIEELMNNTTSEWTTQNGVNGLLVTSKRNGNSIFFPACGYRLGSGVATTGEYGGYWSATPDDEDNRLAFSIIVNSNGLGFNWYERQGGFCIRPVTKRPMK